MDYCSWSASTGGDSRTDDCWCLAEWRLGMAQHPDRNELGIGCRGEVQRCLGVALIPGMNAEWATLQDDPTNVPISPNSRAMVASTFYAVESFLSASDACPMSPRSLNSEEAFLSIFLASLRLTVASISAMPYSK